MDRALTLIGTIGTALSFLPGLSDFVKWVIFASGMTVGLGGLAHMAWERRVAFAGWLGRRMPSRQDTAPAVSQEPEFISLYEVALQGYERTRDTFMAKNAERLGWSDPLGWYAKLLETEIPLYGRRLPSRVMERFEEPGFHLEADGERFIAKQSWGDDRWEDISVRSTDLPRALAFIDERAVALTI